jgi:hypothetical protein
VPLDPLAPDVPLDPELPLVPEDPEDPLVPEDPEDPTRGPIGAQALPLYEYTLFPT